MAPNQERTVPPEWGDEIDIAIFEQILEMDDEEDDNMDFSKSIVFDFLDQAEATFARMETNLESKNLEALSSDGHFLKGSSATLGFTLIKDACEKIQNYGKKTGADGTGKIDDERALELIESCITEARIAFVKISKLMHKFYDGFDERDS